MDFRLLKSQVLVAIRAKQSQMQVSKKLGYSYNKVYRWESDATRMSWEDFVDFCKACRSNLENSLLKILQYDGDLKDIKNLMRCLAGGISKDHIAKRLDISTSQMSRLINGKANPSVEQVFQVIYVTGNYLLEMITNLLPIKSELPSSFKQEVLHRNLEKEFYYKNPYAAVVIRCLETKIYESLEKHNAAILGELCGISQNEVNKYITELKGLGLIHLEEKKFKPVNKCLYTADNFQEYIKTKQYWLSKQIKYLDQVHDSGVYSDTSLGTYSVYTTNDRAFDKVKEAYNQFRREMKSILQSDLNRGEHNKVMVYNMQMTDIIDSVDFKNPH